MKPSSLICLAVVLVFAVTFAEATPIGHGGSILGIQVLGTASIYHIFGHPGNPGGDYGPDSSAVLITFSAGGGNIFSFSALGAVSCCSNAPNIPPDGALGGTSIGGANGLSSISGNAVIPLVGVFTTDVDPFGGVAPVALVFDANSPTSLSPLLNQVFYIGDGKSGYLIAGSTLTFTAPTTATRLYLGVIDAYSFNNLTGYYNDNRGQFDVDVSLEGTAVPEPASIALLAIGLSGLLAASQRKR